MLSKKCCWGFMWSGHLGLVLGGYISGPLLGVHVGWGLGFGVRGLYQWATVGGSCGVGTCIVWKLR